MHQEDDFNAIINLNVRGSAFQITRDELMSLPESILLCLFPNGVFLDQHGMVITNLTEDAVVYVDFSPECFKYIIDSFSKASESMQNINNNNHNEINNDYPDLYYDDDYSNRPLDASILRTKPSIIVLREDLDFYCIPPTTGLSSQQMKRIKIAVARELVNHQQIFEGLGYKPGQNNSKQLGPAEQHLLDMLCNAGYSTSDTWGHRDIEPNKSVISSLALVQLKVDRDNNSNSKDFSGPGSPRSSLAESQNSAAADLNSKLLLFWKKPARKCWWSNEVLEVKVPELAGKLGSSGSSTGKVKVKIHIRRVWTLELAVLSLN